MRGREGGGYISTFHIRGTLYPGLDIRGSSSILQLEFRDGLFARSDPLVKEAPPTPRRRAFTVEIARPSTVINIFRKGEELPLMEREYHFA